MTPSETKKTFAQDRFIPCKTSSPLVEPELEAARSKRPGRAAKKRATCSSFKMTRNGKNLGQKFCAKAKSISRGGIKGNPYLMRSFRHVRMTMPHVREKRENFASGDSQITALNPSPFNQPIPSRKIVVPTSHD
jgi:hypothetical protein